MAKLPVTTNYNNFDPEWYIHMYVDKPLQQMDSKSSTLTEFHVNQMEKMFSSGNIKGRKLLDVGTGPTIQSVVSASGYVQEIYLSDVANSNLQILTDWLECKRDLTIQLPYSFQMTKNNPVVAEKVKDIRSKVKGILQINIASEHPFGDGVAVRKFDVITSKLCLESASKTTEEYRSCVKHLADLLLPGGFLLVAGVIGGAVYRVGNFMFAGNCIEKGEILKAFQDAGVSILKFEELTDTDRNEFNVFNSIFVLLAKKT